MKYDIRKYLDQARTFYRAISSFWNWGGYWKAGNIFDTMTDYLKVSGDNPDGVARIAYYFYQTLPGACWYDDYAWWGIAGSKAFDPTYDHIFEGSKSDFQTVATQTWRFMKEAPNVWAKCNQADFNQYSNDPEKSRWAVPRIDGGVWQYDMFKDPRYPAPTLPVPEFSPCNPSDPCSPLTAQQYVTLGPFQNTVVNALYLLLAGSLNAAKVVFPDDPPRPPVLDPGKAAEREYNFLYEWWHVPDPQQNLFWTIASDAYLVRERVSSYAQVSSGDFPPVREYYPNAAWCGDQGLLMGGLEVYLNKVQNKPEDAAFWAGQLIKGVQEQLTKDGIVQYLTAPDEFKQNVGDFGDYMCGPGVFMRNLLRVFQNNTVTKSWILKFIPSHNFLHTSAEDACNYDPTKYTNPAEVLFDLFNRLATLTTAYVILGYIK